MQYFLHTGELNETTSSRQAALFIEPLVVRQPLCSLFIHDDWNLKPTCHESLSLPSLGSPGAWRGAVLRQARAKREGLAAPHTLVFPAHLVSGTQLSDEPSLVVGELGVVEQVWAPLEGAAERLAAAPARDLGVVA
jgi:hypothetical protein